MQKWIKIHPADTVAVTLCDLGGGTVLFVDGCEVVLAEAIPRGHKFALKPIKNGQNIIKYGNPIGHAIRDIKAGAWVHTHNLATNLGETAEYTYRGSSEMVGNRAFEGNTKKDCGPGGTERMAKTFRGFRREDGSAGIRNELWILPTVGCVNSVVQAMERSGRKYITGTVEDVIAFSHPYGCSQMGEDQENTRRILADLARHPNAGGVLLVGLGCENSGVESIKKYLGEINEKRIKFLVCQDVEDELEAAAGLLRELAEYAGTFAREEIPVSELCIGLKCGGSDGLSGITANPVAGAFSDKLIKQGGSTILTEVPEMFGAETLLMERCINRKVFDKTVSLICDFKEYFLRHGQTIYENPSPGNKAGGISTLEDKSLGCTQKSGSAPVADVLAYGERRKEKGLTLLSAPGNDLVASTALAAAGAQLVLFTTGRGTPFAAPVPTVKISTNTALAEKKKNWIDFDCGLLTECSTIKERAEELFSYVCEVASGRRVKTEAAGYHDMAIFKQGVTL